MSLVSSALQTLLNVVSPPQCICCGRGVYTNISAICGTCKASVIVFQGLRCRKCSLTLSEGTSGLCESCAKTRRAYRFLLAAGPYEGVVASLVRSLKFDKVLRAADELGELVVQQISADDRIDDDWLLVTVPLSSASFRRRGFNQAELIARVVARRTGMNLRPKALSKITETSDQASLHRTARLSNVKGAFRARQELVENAKILIIDDVITTGATMHECALALKSAGAKEVAAAVAAYSLPPNAPRAFENDDGGQA